MMGRLNRSGARAVLLHPRHRRPTGPLGACPIRTVVDLGWVHALAPYCNHTGRPSAEPELMLRTRILGYLFALRSKRQLGREAQVNLAYCWFCGLRLEAAIPNHSAFSRRMGHRSSSR